MCSSTDVYAIAYWASKNQLFAVMMKTCLLLIASGINKSRRVFSGDILMNEYVEKEIIDSELFSIQVDDTTHIVQKSQCSLIIKYVNASVKLVERFLGFYDTSSSRTAETLFNLASACLEKLDCKSKLIGQCFDVFRRKLKKVVSQEVFVHCLAHRLNLVLCNETGNRG
ncbi:hypothetical protein ILUMI_20846, partial [Ignelater luminosus]